MLYVIALIDPGSRERLTRLRQLAVPFGIPPRQLHGHITLAAYAGSDEDGFISCCKTILSGYGKFSIRYDNIELFASTSAVVAAPRKEGALNAIHGQIAERWEADLNQWTRTDAWQPHTTILYDPQADLDAITKALREAFQPFIAQIERIEFSCEYEDRYEIIDSIQWEQLTFTRIFRERQAPMGVPTARLGLGRP